MSTRGSFTSTVGRYRRTRLQKSRLPETALDSIDTVGERRALITRAGHDAQDFTHFRLGKPTGALDVDSPDDVRLAFAHHDPHGGGPVPDLGLLDVDFRREQALVAIDAFDRLLEGRRGNPGRQCAHGIRRLEEP